MSDESKYQIVISKLSQEIIAQVTDILLNPPETKKYEILKQKLIKIYEESEDRQVKKLIGEMELGDQKPSQLMRKMQDLARGRVTNETLTVMWQSHLPSSVRSVLAVTDSKDMETLATIADKIMENLTPIQNVDSVQPKTSGRDDLVIAEINKLSNRLKNLETRSRSPWKRDYRYRNTSRSRSNHRNSRNHRTPTPVNPNWLCYYHYKFRHKANKCVDPCSWNKMNGKPQEN